MTREEAVGVIERLPVMSYMKKNEKQTIITTALDMAIEALQEPERKTNDLVELRSQIKSGMLRPFVNSGKIYLEDTASGEVIIVCELKEGEK